MNRPDTPSPLPRGCMPGPGGDALLSREYLVHQLGVGINTITAWTSDPDDPLPCYGAGTRRVYFFASDLFAFLKRRGPHKQATATLEHRRKKRDRPPAREA